LKTTEMFYLLHMGFSAQQALETQRSVYNTAVVRLAKYADFGDDGRATLTDGFVEATIFRDPLHAIFTILK